MVAVCPVCHRWVAAYVPRGGDGSGVLIKKHRALGYDILPCDGYARMVTNLNNIADYRKEIATR